MKTISQRTLDRMIKNHQKYLENNERLHQLFLIDVDLSSRNLSEVNLTNAVFIRCKLSLSNFTKSTLEGTLFSACDCKKSIFFKTNLNGAKFEYCILKFCSFNKASLENSSLIYSDLRGTSLKDVDLDTVNFRCVVGNSKEIKSLQIHNYQISYSKNILNIGCESHPIQDWIDFSDRQINRMDAHALTFWKQYKDIILTLVQLPD